MSVKLVNTFSLGMVKLPEFKSTIIIEVYPADLDKVKRLLKPVEVKSYISHKGTAEFLTNLLGIPVEYNREPLQIERKDLLLLVQLKVRLEEGKILSREEVEELYNKGLVKFYFLEIRVEPGIIWW